MASEGDRKSRLAFFCLGAAFGASVAVLGFMLGAALILVGAVP